MTRRVVLGLLIFKVLYFLVIMSLIYFFDRFDEGRADRIHASWLPEFDTTAVSGKVTRHFITWDAAHYLYLSQQGYCPESNSRAFYPLWPLSIRAFASITGLPNLLSGLILANLASVAGWAFFYQLVARRFGDSIALPALLALLAHPGALFYQFLYTESLFFLLLMVAWWGLERNRLLLTAAAAFFLPLTRGVGLFVCLPIAWSAYEKLGMVWKKRASSRGPPAHESFAAFLATAAPMYGMLTCLGLMWIWTGNPFEGIDAQRLWGAHTISNLWNIPKFAVGFFDVQSLHSFRGSLADRMAFLGLLMLLPWIRRLGSDMLVWTYALGILPAMSGTFVSYIRFQSIAFPMFIAIALLASRPKIPFALHGFLVLGFAGQLALLWRFLNYYWAG